jgi:hypothetical protein
LGGVLRKKEVDSHSLMPYQPFERTLNHRGALCLADSASWPAAQLCR